MSSLTWIAVGWSAPLAPPGGTWDWWAAVGVVVVGVALWRATRLHPAVVLVVATVSGALIGDLTRSVGVVPVWGPLVLLLTAITLRVRHFGGTQPPV